MTKSKTQKTILLYAKKLDEVQKIEDQLFFAIGRLKSESRQHFIDLINKEIDELQGRYSRICI